jgi:large subunit ribosomal protein L25
MTKSQKTVLHVAERQLTGKKVKQLRQKGLIPANVYGLGEGSEQIEVSAQIFSKLLREQGDTSLIYLQVGTDKEVPTLIGEVQYDTMTDSPTHVTFKRVNLKVKVTAEIAVEMTGEFEVPNANATLTRNVLEVEALPADLPEVFEVDISGLTEVGQTIQVTDLNYDREKVTILLSEEELESPLVIVQEVKEEVEEAPAESVAGETTAAEGEAALATEGEAPAAQEKKE